MTREETMKFLALIKVAYPSTYKDMDRENKLATVNMWQTSFPNVPYKIMELAFDHFMKTSKFSPTVADMFEMLHRLYYRASGDALVISCGSRDKEALKRANWIITHTSQFRGDTIDHKINYNMIGESDLALLPHYEKPSALLERPLEINEEDL